jgi:aryl-alcohol dehydrogenase-like predicted oxidoreductase
MSGIPQREFGRTGRRLSALGIGTYYDPPFVLAAKGIGWRARAPRKIAAYRAAFDRGVNWVDTAEIYGSEPLVGEALRERRRDEIFVATKVFSNHLRAGALERALERSLRRLGTDFVDLYQIHFPSRRVPIRETIRAMEDLVERGKIRHMGVSNFSLAQFRAAQEAARKHEIVSNQVEYSLLVRDPERELLPALAREGRALLAYRALARGRLAARPGRWAGTFAELEATRSGWTPAQVALAWTLSRGSVVFPIVRASRADHVEESLLASERTLAPADLARLDSLSAARA